NLETHWPQLWGQAVQRARYPDTEAGRLQFVAYLCRVMRDETIRDPGAVIAKRLKLGPTAWTCMAERQDYERAKAMIAGRAEQFRRASPVRPGDKLGHVDRGGIVRETPATLEDALRIAGGEVPRP